MVKFVPGSIAAVLFVYQGTEVTVWVWHSFRKGAESTKKLLHEEHPLVREEITKHFTHLFNMEYNDRSLFMEQVKPWSINLEDTL